jgi:hypothetical protein
MDSDGPVSEIAVFLPLNAFAPGRKVGKHFSDNGGRIFAGVHIGPRPSGGANPIGEERERIGGAKIQIDCNAECDEIPWAARRIFPCMAYFFFVACHGLR